MAKSIAFDLSLNVGDTEKKIQEFISSTDTAKSKLKELERAAIEAAINGNEALAKTFAKAAGELKDQIGDTRQEINNFSSDTRKLDVAVGAVQGIAGAFTATAGAVGLLAGENEDLQKTIAVVSSSMAILNGIQQLSVTLNKSSATGAALYAAANKVLNFSIKETAASLGVLKTALIATGIGAAVVALGLLIANFEKIKEALNGISSADKDLLENQKKKVASSEAELKTLGESENILKSQGKSQKDILKLKVQAIGAAVKEQEIVVQTTKNQVESQVSAAKRNKEILKGLLDFISLPLTLVLETVDQVGKAFGKDFGLREGFKDKVANLIFDPEETAKKGQEEIKAQEATLNKLKNDLAGFQLAINEIDKKASEDAAAKRKKKEEDDAKIREATRDAQIRAIKDANERELAAFDEKSKRELEAAKGNADLINALTAAQAVERQAILDAQAKAAEEKRKELEQKEKEELKKKYEDELSVISAAKLKQAELNKTGDLTLEETAAFNAQELEVLKAQFDAKLITEEEFLTKKKALNDEYNAQKEAADKLAAEREKQLEDLKTMGVEGTFSILNDLNAAFANKNEKNAKKAFENNKKIQIAETLVSTYLGAQKAYTSQIIPGDPTSPIRGAIAAGITIAAGLARVAKIKSTQFNGGGGAGGEGGGANAGGGAAPATAPATNPFTGQQASSVIRPEARPRNQQDNRVYVVESDISSTQNRVRVIENNSNASF